VSFQTPRDRALSASDGGLQRPAGVCIPPPLTKRWDRGPKKNAAEGVLASARVPAAPGAYQPHPSNPVERLVCACT